ncbi:MAG: tRNA (N(6)-L-threonylcarbamoyladenosine(37)-C(2))-methylthiotransferase MtaB [Peptococcaceae bacterium]|nr:tRNA (N(6)-L-threonylcarbamoyladenosine(37)-C(2))-methylthiotransferase MtaB [Peptococcaceae bacterium]
MTGKRVAIVTLGCKVNQYESAVFSGAFLDKGYLQVEFNDKADVYVINTCSVTHLSDRKSRQLIRRAIKTNPAAVVAVTGCYAQGSPDEVLEIPGVDLVIGTKERGRLVEMVEGVKKNSQPVNAVVSLADKYPFEEDVAAPIQERARAFLKIQDGCDNYCTYCVVPYVRGPLRSLPPERVLAQARDLAAAGYSEIVLTGIHTGAYGRDMSNGLTLASLLQRLADIPNIPRIRLGSVDPNDITLELVEVLSGSPVFCRHLHVPLQSGDDGILRKMGRNYTAWEFQNLVNVLKENIPGLGLTTDVIVGFPGETGECFEHTYSLIRKCFFSKLHVFKYSPRAGTPAAGFSGQISAEVKEKRSRKLIDLGNEMAVKFASSLEGQVLEVLVEGQVQEEGGMYEGLTDNYLRTFFPAGDLVTGSVLPIKIEGTHSQGLIGRVCLFDIDN